MTVIVRTASMPMTMAMAVIVMIVVVVMIVRAFGMHRTVSVFFWDQSLI